MPGALTYKKAGVDIDRAELFIKRIKPLVAAASSASVLGSIGGFGGFFKGDFKGMKEPVLVAAADGVGTKLMAADIACKHDTVGIDLVAMSVNDLITTGARPLFFLDYFATGRIEPDKAVDIVKGIVEGCRRAGCALIGGETAEMPGLYSGETYDLAGFCVGVVDRQRIIDGSKVKSGDRLIGLASNGIHSNGYSLVRRLFKKSEIKGSFRRVLLAPTAIYVGSVLRFIARCNVKGIAHITGGGFYDNIPRILPRGTAVTVNKKAWKPQRIFEIIRQRSGAPDKELYRTFNMGIGMVLIVAKADADNAVSHFKNAGVRAYEIGEVIKWAQKEVII